MHAFLLPTRMESFVMVVDAVGQQHTGQTRYVAGITEIFSRKLTIPLIGIGLML